GMRHTGHPWPGWRTARVLRAALRVSDCLWRVRGGGGAKSNGNGKIKMDSGVRRNDKLGVVELRATSAELRNFG
ncbi:hypothetical protein ABIE09_004940, partial [Lysobacter enzymogenes]|uniref:hypothetical protein n=1 Tax=Lysobacter enzymogenes TaxID=69 RepID=UPI0033910DA4